MKNIIIIALLLFIQFSFSQEEDSKDMVESKKGNWILTNQFGVVTLEAKDYFKTTAFVFEGILGREFYLNNRFSLVTGLEFLRVRASFQDLENNELFIYNTHVNLPISLKFYNERDNNVALFGEIGLYGSYLYNSKIENIMEDETRKEKNLGFNFGQHFIAGLRFKLDERFGVSFGFKYKSDFASLFKDSKQEFELNEYYAIQLGLSFAQ